MSEFIELRKKEYASMTPLEKCIVQSFFNESHDREWKEQAAAELAALKAENERLRRMEQELLDATAQACIEISELAAQRERLLVAVRNIAAMPPHGYSAEMAKAMADIARAAEQP